MLALATPLARCDRSMPHTARAFHSRLHQRQHAARCDLWTFDHDPMRVVFPVPAHESMPTETASNSDETMLSSGPPT
jgi:hypothetical protein